MSVVIRENFFPENFGLNNRNEKKIKPEFQR